MCDITIPRVQIGEQSGGKKASYLLYSGVFYTNENNKMNYLLDYLTYFLDFPPKMTELDTEILIVMLPSIESQ